MVSNNFDETKAQEWVTAAGDDAADRELALRVYTSRLIGQDPDLVMHGGGNTSVKLERQDLFGKPVQVLHIKGSGWDLGTIQAPGLPAVRLQPLQDLRQLKALSDEDMVNVQRCNLLDSTAPNPSVETLLHAYLPHVYVDHTHATAFLVLANLPQVEDAVKEIFGTRLALVPFIAPGFQLAKAAAEAYEANPDVEGLLLINHGHFTFGASAQESYNRVIEHTNMVEDWIASRARPLVQVPSTLPNEPGPAAQEIFPLLRGAWGDNLASATGEQDSPMPVFDLRCNEEVMAFFARKDWSELVNRGVATPDHVIRTKGRPIIIDDSAKNVSKQTFAEAISAYVEDYKAYFDKEVQRFPDGKQMLDPLPRVAWIKSLGIVGMGSNAKAASTIADLAEQTLAVMARGEDSGGYRPINSSDQFDMEYWSLEQAKLSKGKPARMQGKVVMITGAAGAIGTATAQAFAHMGCDLFLVDNDSTKLDTVLQDLGGKHTGMVGDVTDPDVATAAVNQCAARFGGLDILIANAGAAWTGEMIELSDSDLRSSFELNFFAHRNFAVAAAKVYRLQGRGGQVIVNVSKQAVNPGKGFGAYGLPKAASMFLVKQLALELGSDGVRVNGLNPDRIRSGLLTAEFIQERSKARGVSPEQYMVNNLLKREVEAHHVADAFVTVALSERTTAHVLPVDGGNIEASLR